MKLKVCLFLVLVSVLLSLPFLTACQKDSVNTPDDTSDGGQSDIPDETKETGEDSETKLYYQGHASIRLTAKDGTVIYIDPYAGDGYDLPADIILVTHQHSDHNVISLVTQKDDCTVISNKEAIIDGVHQNFTVKGIEIESVWAENSNHNPKDCVGYIITVDGIKIYHAGDTSKTEQMSELTEKEIDYALLPCDGIYNMDAKEAAECAGIIGAKHNIPIHTKNGELFNRDVAESFDAPNRLIVEDGEEITLTK